jgi:hypothetical protein
MRKLERIIGAGQKLAAQVGGSFTISPAKLADFLRREAHPNPSEKE